jgi:uncharacterized membrane protein YgcG
MTFLLRRTRILALILAAVLLGEAVPLSAQVLPEGSNRIENIRVQINGRSSVYIDYDLIGPTDQTFKVSLTMRKVADTTFTYVPQNVAGDIGANVFPGRNNRIVWSLAKEFPDGIREGEYTFEFGLNSGQDSTGGISTPVLIAGGAALVGGILALILSKGGGTDTGGGRSSFPAPPGRP